MIFTKKRILSLVVVIFLIFFVQTVVNASLLDKQEGFGTDGGEIGRAFDQAGAPKDPRLIIAGYVQAILGFMGIILVAFYIYAGFLWMTAGGSDERITKSKQILQNATIGLVIVLASFGITQFVMQCALEVTGAMSSPWYCGN